jgi:hypothetical protein
MTIYTWDFGSADAGLEFIVEWDDLAQQFTVTCLTGSFDLNALWFSNGDTTTDGNTTLVKSDNSLNMNGNTIVWDGTNSTTEAIVWDDYAKVSSTGTVSDTFFTTGSSQTFTLSDLGLTEFDPTIYATLGVRATSVNGAGGIKWADAEPEIDEGPGGGGLSGRIVYSAPGANDLDVLAFTFAAPALGGPAILAPMLTGTFQNVNVGPGDQTNPHVSGDIATYTSTDLTSEIRYYDFFTNTDQVVPTVGVARLSDISEGRIAYSQITGTGSEIGVYDTADNSTFIIPGGTFRVRPSIGSETVAFEDRSFSANPLETEIVVYDLATNTTTRLTNDSMRDTNPDVSPDGNVVVWQKGDTTGVNMDVYVSLQTAPGVWSTSALTGSPGEDLEPTTDGSIIAYSSDRDGDADIYFQPVGGGPEQHLDLPGIQRNPSISGGGIAFESNEVGGQFDIYLYDTSSLVLYQVTNTAVDESLVDFSAFPEDFII